MKVKMILQTTFGGPALPGEVIDVPADFAERWSRNGIAKIVESKKESKPASKDEPEQPPEGDEVLSRKELYEKCISLGLDVEAKREKAYYLEQLKAVE